MSTTEDRPDWEEETKLPLEWAADSFFTEQVRHPYLVVLSGSQVGQVHDLNRSPMVIGRTLEADIALAEPQLSRRHAELRSGDGGVYLVDLGSRNGTFVNDEPIGQVALRDGDRLRLGTTLVLKYSSGNRIEEVFNRDMYAARCKLASTVAELQRAQERLVQAERLAALGQMAAGVAHEINNPLSFVVANLSFVAEQLETLTAHLSAPQRDELRLAIQDAAVGAERVRLIVRDLKTFARNDEPKPGQVDVRRALEDAIQLTWNEVRHRARLTRDLAAVPMVAANESRLSQVFINLLLNAAQSIPEGKSAENSIHVTTRRDQLGRVVVGIRDTGSGIDPSIAGRIFDPFFTTKPVGSGIGLGLSICHGIVLGLGGEILVESEPGKGTAFRVVLPAGPEQVFDEDTSEVEPVETRRRLLVIDDEAPVGRAIQRCLAQEYDIRVLTSAAEGLRYLERGERFDAILCDLLMPEMTGMDFFARTAEIAPDQLERIIILTGGAFTPRAREFLEAIPNVRLEKPFDPKELRKLLRKYRIPALDPDV